TAETPFCAGGRGRTATPRPGAAASDAAVGRQRAGEQVGDPEPFGRLRLLLVALLPAPVLSGLVGARAAGRLRRLLGGRLRGLRGGRGRLVVALRAPPGPATPGIAGGRACARVGRVAAAAGPASGLRSGLLTLGGRAATAPASAVRRL